MAVPNLTINRLKGQNRLKNTKGAKLQTGASKKSAAARYPPNWLVKPSTLFIYQG